MALNEKSVICPKYARHLQIGPQNQVVEKLLQLGPHYCITSMAEDCEIHGIIQSLLERYM